MKVPSLKGKSKKNHKEEKVRGLELEYNIYL